MYKDERNDNVIEVGRNLAEMENFTMVPNTIIKHKKLSTNAKMVWIELYSYHYGDKGRIFPGMERVAANLNFSKATTLRARKELEAIGLVKVERKGFKLTNHYTLYKPVANHDVAPVTGHDVAPVVNHDVAPVTHKENRELTKTKKNKTSICPVKIKPSVTATTKEIKSATKEIINHLNATVKKDFKKGKGTTALIAALMKDGVKVGEVQLVTDFKSSCWLDDDKMDEYLRPSTLFSEKNFDDYLAQAISWDAKGRRRLKKKTTGYQGIQSNDDYGSVVV